MSNDKYPLQLISEWSPITKPKSRKWFLIAGTSKPPEKISVSSRKPRESGKYLTGVNYDFANMEKVLKNQLKNSVRDLEMTKSEAKDYILKFFEYCYEYNYKPMLYYTGHGEKNTGDWCFSDGKIGIEEIFSWCLLGKEYPTIISDACYSGNWAINARRKAIKGFQVLSACGPDEIAQDTG